MRRGFTLIEVLVVVAIIALLISILIPSLAVARDQARSAKCLANMRDMATGVMTFSSTHKNKFQLVTGSNANPDPYSLGGPAADVQRSQYAYESGPLPVGAQGPALLAWPVVLLREAGRRELKRNMDWGVEAATRDAAIAKSPKNFELTVCPADELKFATPVYPYPKSGQPNKWFGSLSYAINEDVVGDDRVQTTRGACYKDGEINGGSRLLGNLDKVVRPGEVLLFTDGGIDKKIDSNASSENNQPWNLILSHQARGPLLEHCDKQWPNRLPVQRHRRGSLNIAFVDGHGSWVKKAEHTPTDDRLPSWSYLPKVRVSPYNPGGFPNLN
jgi:prepilin-type N-terminal cleavage/methylation domain-containing protein/prepilin-type processing-associated H-X9-DG protein